MMEKTATPYAACRGPAKGFKNHPKGVKVWAGNFTRLAAGCSMYRYPDFYNATAAAREYYSKIIKSGSSDKFDEIPSASYREYDEVMLFRLCKMSGLRISAHSNIFLTGDKFNPKFRDVHLGDFKFLRRWQNKAKMKRILHQESIDAMRILQKSQQWRELLSWMEPRASSLVLKLLKNMETHIKGRR